MIKILAITGIRSEYDYLFPILKEMKSNSDFSVKIVVCGSHLSDWHGNTIKRIETDGFEIADRIDNLLFSNRDTQRAKGVGLLSYGISQTVDRERPDILLYVGDREEGIAAAIVSTYMQVLFAHVGGGDTVYGNADDPIRFAISKLAHIHFTLSEQYSQNLKLIGEESFRVCWSGSPSIDNIRNMPSMNDADVQDELGQELNLDRFNIVLMHPLSSESKSSYEQMKILLEVVKEFNNEHGYHSIGIYPNTDPGSRDIVKAIDEYADDESFTFYKNLPSKLFINLVKRAKCLIGNSSMGILEAPYYGLPVVNVGNRQKGRVNSGNVVFVKLSKDAIYGALLNACFNNDYRTKVSQLKNIYGDGHASKRIVDFISNIDLRNGKWYLKRNEFVGVESE